MLDAKAQEFVPNAKFVDIQSYGTPQVHEFYAQAEILGFDGPQEDPSSLPPTSSGSPAMTCGTPDASPLWGVMPEVHYTEHWAAAIMHFDSASMQMLPPPRDFCGSSSSTSAGLSHKLLLGSASAAPKAAALRVAAASVGAQDASTAQEDESTAQRSRDPSDFPVPPFASTSAFARTLAPRPYGAGDAPLAVRVLEGVLNGHSWLEYVSDQVLCPSQEGQSEASGFCDRDFHQKGESQAELHSITAAELYTHVVAQHETAM